MRDQEHARGRTSIRSRPESPVGWTTSLFLFGVPGSILVFTIHVLNPALVEAGVPLVVSFTLSLYGVLFGLLVATLICLRRSGYPMTRDALVERLRLRPLQGREWWWVGGAVVLAFAADSVLESTMRWMADTLPLPIPDHLPSLFDPREELSLPPAEYFGVTLEGRWIILVVYTVSLVGNIVGEELWWRGYVLPRQEQAFGRWAWLVNGVLWVVVFHAFMWWALPTLLATGLLTPLVAQRLRSTWAAIVVHGTGNALFLLLLLAGVLEFGA